jgi:hypothetical protein
MRGALFLVALGLAACGTEGAVLELEIVLPPAGACGADRATVRAAFERDIGGDGACPADEWASGDCTANLPLGDAASTTRISIVATEDDVAEPLCVRVTFGDAGCAVGALPPGTTNLRVSPAFRDAGYTELTVAIDDACAPQDLGVLSATPIP